MVMSPLVKQERFENVSMLVLEVESVPSPRRVEISLFDSNQGRLGDKMATYECPPVADEEETICVAQGLE